jgi:hypothetical protein
MVYPKITGKSGTGTEGIENLISGYGGLVNLQVQANKVDRNLGRQIAVVPQILQNTEGLGQLGGALGGGGLGAGGGAGGLIA